jgi:hypothetical protein
MVLKGARSARECEARNQRKKEQDASPHGIQTNHASMRKSGSIILVLLLPDDAIGVRK